MKEFLKRLYTRMWCFLKQCDGMTGTHADCIYCKGYNPNNTNCDIPE